MAKLAGCDNINRQSIETAKCYLHRLSRSIPNCRKYEVYTDEMILQYCSERIDELNAAKAFCMKGTHNALNVNSSAYRTVVYIGILSGISDEILNRFLTVLTSGFYEDESEKTIVVLRNKIIDSQKTGTRFLGWTARENLISLCEKTLSAYWKHENLSYLKTTAFNELTKVAIKTDLNILDRIFK